MSSDDDEYVDLNVITRKRKSILQPSGSKYSKKARKATGRRRSHPDPLDPTLSDSHDDDDDDREISPVDESPITTIKNGEHLRFVTDLPTTRSSSDASRSPQYLPRKYLELEVVEFKVPCLEPQGPGDLWTCTFDGCHHRIHKASTADGKSRIRDHFGTHTNKAQEKINLALNESRPYLPVK